MIPLINWLKKKTKRTLKMTIDDITGSITYEQAIKYGIVVGRPIHCKNCVS